MQDSTLKGKISPTIVYAGNRVTLRLSCNLPYDITEKHIIYLVIGSTRQHAWQWEDLPQTEDCRKNNYISATINNKITLKGISLFVPLGIKFEVPHSSIKKNAKLNIEYRNFKMISFAVRNYYFSLFIRRVDEEIDFDNDKPSVIFIFDIMGGSLRNMRLFAPSIVEMNKPLSSILRPQDKYGNISKDIPKKITLTIDNTKENIEITKNMITPVDTVEINNIKISKVGVIRIKVEDAKNRVIGTSSPIQVKKEKPEERLYWGMIHEHTNMSDGLGSIDEYFTNMRYGGRLDFGASSDHDHRFEITDEMWRIIQEKVKKYYVPGEFVTFLGYEWAKWRKNGDGDRNVYYLNDNKPMYRSETGEYDTPKKLFDVLKNEQVLVIPHHTAFSGNFCDWKEHDEKIERLVEIYSVWGNSETEDSSENLYPVRDIHKGGAYVEKSKLRGINPVGFVQRALELGWRVGFVAGGDMHRSYPGDDVRCGFSSWAYKAGLVGVWAKEKTRKAIFKALWSRRCYGITGARIIVDYDINGYPMGSEIFFKQQPGIESKRKFRIKVYGTSLIKKIELIRNNEIIYTFESTNKLDLDIEWEDNACLDRLWLPQTNFSKERFIFYYLRIRQNDDEMAWASPIWIIEK